MSSNSQKNPSTFSEPSDDDITWIPDGFELVRGPDGERFIIPEYLFPALQQKYNANEREIELKATEASGSVSPFLFLLACRVPYYTAYR